jgi:hypothetical protein
MTVCGVAGQQDAADPVLRHLPFVAVEAGHPARLVHAVVIAEGTASHVDDLVERQRDVVRYLLVAVPREHPIPAVAKRRDERKAVTDTVDGQRVGQRPGQLHVREHD